MSYIMGERIVIKTADEDVTNSTTLQDDDDLLFAVAANEKWQFEGVLQVAGHTDGDVKIAFTGPTGSVGMWGASGWDNASSLASPATAAENLGSSDVLQLTSAAVMQIFRFWGAISNGSTAGSLKLQWAQNASHATSTQMQAGSYMKYRRQAS